MAGSAEPGEARLRLPQLRLDELLEEVQARLDAVRGTRDRVHNLLEAVLSVGSELDLEQVLRSIVQAAAVLVDARYAALGVIGPDGRRLADFHTVGVTDDQITEIGNFPEGHGILGELIRNPEPLRLAKLSDHPASYGFPPHHPPMNTFVGVPIRVRDQVFGNLYLTEKRGGAQFDDEDESVLATLAVAAGVAIDNARLYEESRLRERWLRASAEITHSIMSGSDRAQVLRLIAERAREITGAELAVVAVPTDGTDADDTLTVELALGREADAHQGLVLPVRASLIGRAFATATTVTSADITQDDRVSSGPPRFTGLGPAVAVPIGSGDGVRGVVLLVREAGQTVFTEQRTEPLKSFAGQAAVAMELAERRRDAERIAVLQDRDRIARDLHDLAIQRLFATGMTLQSAGRFIEHPGAASGCRARWTTSTRPSRSSARRSSGCAPARPAPGPACAPARSAWWARPPRSSASRPGSGWTACSTPASPGSPTTRRRPVRGPDQRRPPLPGRPRRGPRHRRGNCAGGRRQRRGTRPRAAAAGCATWPERPSQRAATAGRPPAGARWCGGCPRHALNRPAPGRFPQAASACHRSGPNPS
ncbi:hypothetical protein SGLAM104S_08024 [Streptomyces glaucescens]